MAKESSDAPLPRRVPGAADSPRPPARIKPPPLPPSLIERLRAAAEAAREEEEETARAEVETAHPERKPASKPATPPDVPVPFPRSSPSHRDAPGLDEPPPPLPSSLIERLRAAAEIAKEEETAHAEMETAHPERKPASKPTTSPEVPVPFPRRSLGRRDAPGPDQEDEAVRQPPSVP